MTNIAQLLVNNPLFSGITPKQLEVDMETVHYRIRTFHKGEMLARQTEPCNRLMVLLQGSVRGEMVDFSGRLVKVEDIVAPGALAPLFLFGEANRYPVEVTANETVELIELSRDEVLKLLHLNGRFLENYLNMSANYARRLADKLFAASFNTIRQKMAACVLRLSQAQQTDCVRLDRSQQELSEYFGVSRPSLTRELTRMKNEGLLSVDKREVRILQKDMLLQLVR
ncbi:MAG: Crp/Fnr family transcriptional regulator [Mediterranea sp.]|jgi:CRP-like cAMP-binding protein|nr:Crp/Fnr family transcriptional regulator [Mediterranea sp.]